MINRLGLLPGRFVRLAINLDRTGGPAAFEGFLYGAGKIGLGATANQHRSQSRQEINK